MSKKVVIIGGGVAGLSAGIYSAMNGFETELLEMHSITGGQCTAWERKGYRFDYCLHWLVGTAEGPFNEIWKETNVLNDKVEIIDHEVFSKNYDEAGNEFVVYTSLDRWEKYLINMAPEDEKKIRMMCNDMRKSSFLDPFSDPPGLRNPVKTTLSMFRMMPVMSLFMKYGKMSCDEYFRKLDFQNDRLRYFLGKMAGSKDFSALAIIMMFAWFNRKNAGYLVGGSLPLAQRMTERYLSLGGKLSTGKRVSRIIVRNDSACGVVLSDGTQIDADYVISAADGHATLYDMLEGKYLTEKIRNAYDNWELFTPIVQVSFGVNKVFASESTVESHISDTITIGSTHPEQGYSIMNYSFDRTMAPEGKSVIIMRFGSPWELWNEMPKEKYNTEKDSILKDATALLENRFPGISSYIEVTDVATPLTDFRYTGVWKGSYEGFIPGSKNLMKNLEPRVKGLKNFYMAGQWLSPGGGLPPAGQTGKWAIQYICKEEGIKFRAGK